MATGKCKLTGSEGKLVKAHLIPRALTMPEGLGSPLIQLDSGERAVRRWSSWYDKNLVTEEGETILSEYDDWAIKTLRMNKLIWSGWGPMMKLGHLHKLLPGTDWGMRELSLDEPSRLRLFFLSLLWRAAVSDRPEFADVTLPVGDIEILKNMLLKRNSSPLSFYPASLMQFSTLGNVHNMAPISQEKVIPAFEPGEGDRHIPIFRFYFDGLVTHIERQRKDDGHAQKYSSLFVGGGNRLIVSTIPYDGSFEQENLLNVMMESIY